MKLPQFSAIWIRMFWQFCGYLLIHTLHGIHPLEERKLNSPRRRSDCGSEIRSIAQPAMKMFLESLIISDHGWP